MNRLATAALCGPWSDLIGFRSIDDLLDHFRVPEPVWRAFELQVGSPGSDLHLLAAPAKVALVQGCGNALTPQGQFYPMQATQVGLVWRLARRVTAAQANVREADFADVDPWLESDPGPSDTARPEHAQRPSAESKKGS